MDIMLLAHTMITPEAEQLLKPEMGVDDADYLAELAGRDCYQSFDRPNPKTRDNVDYLGTNIIFKEHFSVLEHATATLRFTGVSRSLTHELVRHRHFSFSQLSQRYVSIEDMAFVVPPVIRDWPDEDEREGMIEELNVVWQTALDSYKMIDRLLGEGGESHKRAREAARAVLPNMTETIIDVTGNHRAWREFLTKRWSVHADREIHELAGRVLEVLRTIAPNTYQDFTDATR